MEIMCTADIRHFRLDAEQFVDLLIYGEGVCEVYPT